MAHRFKVGDTVKVTREQQKRWDGWMSKACDSGDYKRETFTIKSLSTVDSYYYLNEVTQNENCQNAFSEYWFEKVASVDLNLAPWDNNNG